MSSFFFIHNSISKKIRLKALGTVMYNLIYLTGEILPGKPPEGFEPSTC